MSNLPISLAQNPQTHLAQGDVQQSAEPEQDTRPASVELGSRDQGAPEPDTPPVQADPEPDTDPAGIPFGGDRPDPEERATSEPQ